MNLSRFVAAPIAALAVCATASPALAWGEVGHKVTALIAYRHLEPAVRAKVDALLAADTDILTPPDFASRASWADRWDQTHKETAKWHFADVEIGDGDLAKACYNFPKLAAGQAASAGPADDCVVNKIAEFAVELHDPATSQAERILALRYLVHFVGDIHQPLHVADHDDRGGNCILLDDGSGQRRNLHGFWDTGVVKDLGPTPEAIADSLDAKITSAEITAWTQGGPLEWATESFRLSTSVVYKLPALPTCADHTAPMRLEMSYIKTARVIAAEQLQKGGIRLAALLNAILW
jgi:hypothetical protein